MGFLGLALLVTLVGLVLLRPTTPTSEHTSAEFSQTYALNHPEVILADEPTGALDSQTGRLVMDLFHELNRERGTSIVFITHNPELAAECSRTVTMTDGVLK